MSLVSVCGGGGKTTICNKYPGLFLDIDSFVWSDVNKLFHKRLRHAIRHAHVRAIGTIYQDIMTQNGSKIDVNKIILAHHPINAKWLNVRHMCSIKPNKQLHEANIKGRSIALQNIARNCWNNLKNAIVYNSYEEFEHLLLSLARR